MATPEYIKRANNNYNSKFDIIQIKFEKGTKERIKAITQESYNDYIKRIVYADLDKAEGKENQEESDLVPEGGILDGCKTESEKRDALQAFIDAKRQEIAAAKKRAPGAVTEEDAKRGIGTEAKTDPLALFPTEIIHQNLEIKKEM